MNCELYGGINRPSFVTAEYGNGRSGWVKSWGMPLLELGKLSKDICTRFAALWWAKGEGSERWLGQLLISGYAERSKPAGIPLEWEWNWFAISGVQIGTGVGMTGIKGVVVVMVGTTGTWAACSSTLLAFDFPESIFTCFTTFTYNWRKKKGFLQKGLKKRILWRYSREI